MKIVGLIPGQVSPGGNKPREAGAPVMIQWPDLVPGQPLAGMPGIQSLQARMLPGAQACQAQKITNIAPGLRVNMTVRQYTQPQRWAS